MRLHNLQVLLSNTSPHDKISGTPPDEGNWCRNAKRRILHVTDTVLVVSACSIMKLKISCSSLWMHQTKTWLRNITKSLELENVSRLKRSIQPCKWTDTDYGLNSPSIQIAQNILYMMMFTITSLRTRSGKAILIRLRLCRNSECDSDRICLSLSIFHLCREFYFCLTPFRI